MTTRGSASRDGTTTDRAAPHRHSTQQKLAAVSRSDLATVEMQSRPRHGIQHLLDTHAAAECSGAGAVLPRRVRQMCGPPSYLTHLTSSATTLCGGLDQLREPANMVSFFWIRSTG